MQHPRHALIKFRRQHHTCDILEVFYSMPPLTFASRVLENLVTAFVPDQASGFVHTPGRFTLDHALDIRVRAS